MLQVEWDITEQDLDQFNKRYEYADMTRYVYYDPETGIIKYIAGSLVYDLPYVSVEYDQVKGIIEGTDNLENYKIVFSPDDKDFVFIKKEDEEETLETIDEIIFKIPFITDTSYPLQHDPFNDITVIQDYTDTCWKIYINALLIKSLKSKHLYFDKEFHFYITAYNDPNILYKTMIIPMKELLENSYFIIPFDFLDYSETKISIFTRKIFTKYQHIKTKL